MKSWKRAMCIAFIIVITFSLARADCETQNAQADENMKTLSKKLENLKTKMNVDGIGSCSCSNGVTIIFPPHDCCGTFVYCDNVTDGGGWTVFQRRQNGSVSFAQNWDAYVNGFGDLRGEFWMGLELLHRLTSVGNYELRIDLEDWEGDKRYAKYSTFMVDSSSENYTLHIDGYSGTVDDSMSYTTNQQFSTFDRDNDPDSRHCSQVYNGGWWFAKCFRAFLNGVYQKQGSTGYGQGIIWSDWKGWYYSLKFAEMKFRLRRD